MSTNANTSRDNINSSLILLTANYDAMQLAQLSAFAFSIPQLYFCREYLSYDESEAIEQCLQRLNNGLNEQLFTVDDLLKLSSEKEFFDSNEARLRLSPDTEVCEE